MNKTTRQNEANKRFEQAAALSNRNTNPSREKAARIITEGNAIKAGRPVPKRAKGVE